jgi:LPS-assembly lipoprotein
MKDTNVTDKSVRSRLTLAAATLLLTGLMSGMLSACGFQPLYSQNGSSPAVQAEMASIIVDVPMSDASNGERLEQLVYSSLMGELTPLGTPPQPAWRLEVAVQQISKGVGFEEDDSVTRFNVQILSSWRLVDTSNQTVVFTSASRSIAAYNVVTSQFATLTAEKDAVKRAAVDLARDITLQLSLHFRKF